jgi:hypothetical protein
VLLAVLVLVAAIVAIAWAITSVGGSPAAPQAPAAAAPPAAPKIGPIGLSSAGLKTFAATTLQQPVYWAGPKRGNVYELTRTTPGNVYVRYLPPGVKVNDPRASFLIIATYPYANAFSRLKAVAHGGGVTLRGGSFALPDPTYPKSVHMAFPGVNYEIEVYDASPRVARSVADSGVVKPVG